MLLSFKILEWQTRQYKTRWRGSTRLYTHQARVLLAISNPFLLGLGLADKTERLHKAYPARVLLAIHNPFFFSFFKGLGMVDKTIWEKAERLHKVIYRPNVANEMHGNWSCDQCWPMRGFKINFTRRGQTHRHTDIATSRLTRPGGQTQWKCTWFVWFPVNDFKILNISFKIENHELSIMKAVVPLTWLKT